MLTQRLLVSAILIPTLIGLLVWDARIGPAAPILFILCLALSLRCGWEAAALFRRPNVELRYGPIAVCLLLLLTATWWPHWLGHAWAPTLSAAFGGCVLFLLAVRVFRFRQSGFEVSALAGEVLAVAYAGLLLCLTAALRWMGPDQNGYQLLGALIFATKMGDVGAYTIGRLFGKRKMAPRISPGKTWAGALGALLGGVFGAALWFHTISAWFGFVWDSERWGFTLLFGAVMGIVGLIGDLGESLLKRDAGVKDSAPLMPGFGGLLDLMDSILFAGPVALVLCGLAHL